MHYNFLYNTDQKSAHMNLKNNKTFFQSMKPLDTGKFCYFSWYKFFYSIKYLMKNWFSYFRDLLFYILFESWERKKFVFEKKNYKIIYKFNSIHFMLLVELKKICIERRICLPSSVSGCELWKLRMEFLRFDRKRRKLFRIRSWIILKKVYFEKSTKKFREKNLLADSLLSRMFGRLSKRVITLKPYRLWIWGPVSVFIFPMQAFIVKSSKWKRKFVKNWWLPNILP